MVFSSLSNIGMWCSETFTCINSVYNSNVTPLGLRAPLAPNSPSLMFFASTYLVKTLLALSLVLVSSMVFGIGKKKWDPKGKVSTKSRVVVLLGVAFL